MPPLHRRVGPVLLAALLLAGCDQDAAQLVKQINDARQGCTQESLQAGDTACVRMMQEYAKMGTEFMKSYIGAVQTLDKTMKGMPAANFDTTGLGHALSQPAESYRSPGDSSTWASGLASGAPSLDRSGYPDQGGYADPGAPYADPRDGYGADPRDYPPADGYDRSSGWGDVTSDPRAYDRLSRGTDPRDADPGSSRGWSGYRDDYRAPRSADPRAHPAPPARGLLLPPSQRLARPWLRDGSEYQDSRTYGGQGYDSRSYDPRSRDPRSYDPRSYDPRYAPQYDPRYDPRRLPIDPRDTLGRYPAPRGGTDW